jgi:hypothetical protein
MGGEAVGDVRWTEANGGACVRAPACAQPPYGTSLGAWSASSILGAQCPRLLRGIGVRARTHGGEGRRRARCTF